MSRQALTLSAAGLAVLFATASLAAGTVTLYRSVDANGVVQYSDRPSPGAQKVSVAPAPGSSGDARAPGAGAASSRRMTGSPGVQAPGQPFRYSVCAIAEPQPDQTYFETDTVPVNLHLEPSLQSGHAAFVVFDGNRVDGSGTSFTLSPVYRGSHSVSATVVDASGSTVCQTGGVSFHVRDTSLLQPNRPAGGAPAAPAAPGVPNAPR